MAYDRTDGWYHAYDLGQGVWRISDHGADNMYLILGRDTALLFDTGFGAGDLSKFISFLASLPVIVAMSHGHNDHACGNDLFGVVYGGAADLAELHPDGAELKRENARMNARQPDYNVLPRDKKAADGIPPKVHVDFFGTPGRLENIAVKDGDVLDLGGRTLRVLETPGHTPGSICLYDEQTDTIFTGDTYVPDAYWGPVWLHVCHSEPLKVYLESLQKLQKLGASRLLSGHGECNFIPGESFAPFIALVEGIISGDIAGTHISTMIGPGLYASCGDTSIIYSAK